MTEPARTTKPMQPWEPGETADEREARREAYQRLVNAARRIGMSVDRLSDVLRQVASNETETRSFLTEVYGVPDALLDDMLRIRLADLQRDE